MTWSQFLLIIRARWLTASLILVLTLSAGVGVSLFMPKRYTSIATLVVDQNRPDPITTYTGGNASPAFMSTQVDVLKSARVGQHVVRKLGLDNEPGARASWMRATKGVGSLEAWLGERLQGNLDVKPSRESNVISVSYTSADPVDAAKVANTFVQAYMDVILELRVDPAKQYSSFFDSRSKELRANVEQAQAKLSAYQKEKGVIIAADGQLDVETARLNELSSQLVALQAVTSESSSRQVQAQSGAADRLQEVVNNPALSGLRGDITRAEARLQELTSRLGDNHPQVIEARANISSLRNQLGTEMRRLTGSFGVTNTINRQREAELRGALEAQRARVMRLRTAREEGAVLIRDVENAQKAYEAVVTRLNQASLESQTTQSNAYVLAQAVPQFLPSSPKIVRNALLSAMLGLVLGIAAALLLELMDRRVHTVDEVSALIGLPLLGVLPGPGGKGRFIGRRTPLVSPRGLFRQLPAPRSEAR